MKTFAMICLVRESMFKILLAGSLLLASSTAFADVYLRAGDSIALGQDRIHCSGDNRPTRPRQPTFYCTVSSAFNGVFSGTGYTELEAQTNALKACQRGSISNGFHCSSYYKCQSRSN